MSYYLGHWNLSHWISAMFLFWNGARFFAYLPTIRKVIAQDADVRSYSLVSWGIWFLSNLTFALMLLEVSGGQPNEMVWMNVGNSIMCMAVFALVVLKRYRSHSMQTMKRDGRRPLKVECEHLREQGNTLMQLGHYEGAVRAYDAFLTHVEDDGTVFNEAICLEKLGRRAEALPLYQQLAQRDVLGALINSSNCLSSLGAPSEALEYASRATRLAPGDPAAWIALGSAHLSSGAWREAVDSFSRARRLNPIDPTSTYKLALAAVRMNDGDLWREELQDVLSLAPLDDSRRRLVNSVSNAGHRLVH
ncbi:tetratricopeptide repeat protein [Paraburkholderia strydomiana]|uniref:tetratricopeptide repeat protein n=1 Tax=Paraburkholderia strydomiana TaxID=1245417 RepID=UPI0038BBA5CB